MINHLQSRKFLHYYFTDFLYFKLNVKGVDGRFFFFIRKSLIFNGMYFLFNDVNILLKQV